MIKPRFSIRAKLLLVSLTLLAVPWVGLSFVKEVERALRQGHEQSVAATAQAVATEELGPLAPNWIEIIPGAMLPMIMGM